GARRGGSNSVAPAADADDEGDEGGGLVQSRGGRSLLGHDRSPFIVRFVRALSTHHAAAGWDAPERRLWKCEEAGRDRRGAAGIDSAVLSKEVTVEGPVPRDSRDGRPDACVAPASHRCERLRGGSAGM